MSRRESRSLVGARQNDALFEFENFKKKFLLANKHITKLNSTLSVRIEELNAQVSTLYVENLRLRASEIALAAQLKREREKSRKIMSEAETATLNLTKHLSYLRQTFNIRNTAPSPPTPPSPRARRKPPPSNTNTSPTTPIQGNRISRPPNVPGIDEEDEAGIDVDSPSPITRKRGSTGAYSSSSSDNEARHLATTTTDTSTTASAPSRRKSGGRTNASGSAIATGPSSAGSGSGSSSNSGSASGPGPTPVVSKSRLAASKLPLPARVGSPPLMSSSVGSGPAAHLDLTTIANEMASATGKSGKKKPSSRRQSGLVVGNGVSTASEALSVPRAASPAFGSPIRRAAALAEGEEDDQEPELDQDDELNIDVDEELDLGIRKERKKGTKVKETEREVELDEDVIVVRPPKERKSKVKERVIINEDEVDEIPLTTVTSRHRATKETAGAAGHSSRGTGRTALLPIDNTVFDADDSEKQSGHPRQFLGPQSTSPPLPTPRSSISPVPFDEGTASTGDGDGGAGSAAVAGGRERRARKSVNYAEPKLNTKMRKPDPLPGTTPAPRKRSSAAAVMSTTTYSTKGGENQGYHDYEDDLGGDQDVDRDRERESMHPLRHTTTKGSNANYDPDPEMLPLPPSRPSSALSLGVSSMPSGPPPSYSSRPPSALSAYSSSSAAPTGSGAMDLGAGTGSVAGIKKKKSRHVLVLEDEDEGAQADAEYGVVGVRGASGWVNVEGRRRAVGSGGEKSGKGGGAGKRGLVMLQDLEDGRRHSMAV